MSTGRQLRAYVCVRDENGSPAWFGPRDDVPAWAAVQIENPAAWAAHDGTAGTGSAAAPSPSTPAVSSPASADDEPPPRSGRGSGTSAWREYASRHQVEVDPDDGRDEIVDALERAGVRTE